jgi:DNA-binding XRE family transcriptional regulator
MVAEHYSICAVSKLTIRELYVAGPPLFPYGGGMTQLSQRLGHVVKVLRERRGLSQERLADQAGLHRSTVYLVENDRSPKDGPTLDTVERLARGLNITPSDLLAYADGSEDPEDEDE